MKLMLIDLFRTLPTVLGADLGVWATQIHALAISLLAVAWLWPGVAYLFRRVTHAETEIEWIQLWRCPQCTNFNRRAFTSCMHCQYSLKLGGWGKWISPAVSEKFKKGGRVFLFYYGLLGRVLFYGITLFAVIKLRMFSFHQNPLQEIAASLILILLLAALRFFYLAFRWRMKSPISIMMDLIAGFAALGLMCFIALAWIQTAHPPEQPLVYFRTLDGGQMKIRKRGDELVQINLPQTGNSVKFEVQYDVLSWPAMGVRHVMVTRVAGMPMVPRWALSVLDRFASPLQEENNFRPRLVPFSQNFQAPAQSSFTLREAQAGMGLLLQKQ